MAGISPRLPLSLDRNDIGHTLNKNIKDTIKQNLKNLVLTNPGERVYDANFGVGIKRFLFENMSEAVDADIISRIGNQISKYMSFLSVNSIKILRKDDYNSISITISYSVPSLSVTDYLSLENLTR